MVDLILWPSESITVIIRYDLLHWDEISRRLYFQEKVHFGLNQMPLWPVLVLAYSLPKQAPQSRWYTHIRTSNQFLKWRRFHFTHNIGQVLIDPSRPFWSHCFCCYEQPPSQLLRSNRMASVRKNHETVTAKLFAYFVGNNSLYVLWRSVDSILYCSSFLIPILLLQMSFCPLIGNSHSSIQSTKSNSCT